MAQVGDYALLKRFSAPIRKAFAFLGERRNERCRPRQTTVVILSLGVVYKMLRTNLQADSAETDVVHVHAAHRSGGFVSSTQE